MTRTMNAQTRPLLDGGAATRCAAANGCRQCSTRPPPRRTRSVRPQSLARLESTAHSSIGTATCWRKSMRCKQVQS
jgi:hypothetical protein